MPGPGPSHGAGSAAARAWERVTVSVRPGGLRVGSRGIGVSCRAWRVGVWRQAASSPAGGRRRRPSRHSTRDTVSS